MPPKRARRNSKHNRRAPAAAPIALSADRVHFFPDLFSAFKGLLQAARTLQTSQEAARSICMQYSTVMRKGRVEETIRRVNIIRDVSDIYNRMTSSDETYDTETSPLAEAKKIAKRAESDAHELLTVAMAVRRRLHEKPLRGPKKTDERIMLEWIFTAMDSMSRLITILGVLGSTPLPSDELCREAKMVIRKICEAVDEALSHSPPEDMRIYLVHFYQEITGASGTGASRRRTDEPTFYEEDESEMLDESRRPRSAHPAWVSLEMPLNALYLKGRVEFHRQRLLDTLRDRKFTDPVGYVDYESADKLLGSADPLTKDDDVKLAALVFSAYSTMGALKNFSIVCRIIQTPPTDSEKQKHTRTIKEAIALIFHLSSPEHATLSHDLETALDVAFSKTEPHASSSAVSIETAFEASKWWSDWRKQWTDNTEDGMKRLASADAAIRDTLHRFVLRVRRFEDELSVDRCAAHSAFIVPRVTVADLHVASHAGDEALADATLDEINAGDCVYLANRLKDTEALWGIYDCVKSALGTNARRALYLIDRFSSGGDGGAPNGTRPPFRSISFQNGASEPSQSGNPFTLIFSTPQSKVTYSKLADETEAEAHVSVSVEENSSAGKPWHGIRDSPDYYQSVVERTLFKDEKKEKSVISLRVTYRDLFHAKVHRLFFPQVPLYETPAQRKIFKNAADQLRGECGVAVLDLETFPLFPKSHVNDRNDTFPRIQGPSSSVKVERTLFEKQRAVRRLLETIDCPLINVVRRITNGGDVNFATILSVEKVNGWDLEKVHVRGRVFKPQHLISPNVRIDSLRLIGTSVNTRAATTNRNAEVQWSIPNNGPIPHAVSVVLQRLPHIFWHGRGIPDLSGSYSPLFSTANGDTDADCEDLRKAKFAGEGSEFMPSLSSRRFESVFSLPNHDVVFHDVVTNKRHRAAVSIRVMAINNIDEILRHRECKEIDHAAKFDREIKQFTDADSVIATMDLDRIKTFFADTHQSWNAIDVMTRRSGLLVKLMDEFRAALLKVPIAAVAAAEEIRSGARDRADVETRLAASLGIDVRSLAAASTLSGTYGVMDMFYDMIVNSEDVTGAKRALVGAVVAFVEQMRVLSSSGFYITTIVQLAVETRNCANRKDIATFVEEVEQHFNDAADVFRDVARTILDRKQTVYILRSLQRVGSDISAAGKSALREITALFTKSAVLEPAIGYPGLRTDTCAKNDDEGLPDRKSYFGAVYEHIDKLRAMRVSLISDRDIGLEQHEHDEHNIASEATASSDARTKNHADFFKVWSQVYPDLAALAEAGRIEDSAMCGGSVVPEPIGRFAWKIIPLALVDFQAAIELIAKSTGVNPSKAVTRKLEDHFQNDKGSRRFIPHADVAIRVSRNATNIVVSYSHERRVLQ